MSTEEIPQPWLDSIPEGRPINMDYEEISLYQFLERRAQKMPDQNFMILPKGVTITFAEAFEMVNKLASALQAAGIGKGDRVALMLNNVPTYVIAHYATLAIGATVVQCNPLYTEPELKHLIEDSGAKALFTLSMFEEKSVNVMKQTDLEFIVLARIQDYLAWYVRLLGKLLGGKISPIFDSKGPTYDAPVNERPGIHYFPKFMESGSGSFDRPDIDLKNDVAVFQYTGGTTGFPKGAMLTHYNLSVNAQQARAMIHMVPEGEGALMTILPMFHVFGLTVCMNLAIQLGIPMILNIANPPDFDDILDWVEKYQITFMPGVPRIFIELNKNPKSQTTDFSSLIAAISGGAPLPLEVAKEFKRNTGADLVEGYGLSETAPLTHVNPIGLPPREESIGLPAPDTNVKIIDLEDGSIKGVGEVGEIAINGPQVFKGYWNMEEETANVLSDDGWFTTGDIGRMDEDGYFYIVDRKKDMIIVSGYNVYPREVEEVLFKHPKVVEAAVSGIQDEKRGEIVGAWVVLKEGENASKEEIIDFCRDNLAPYKVPREVIFRDELPTSMVGKVLRRKLETDEDVDNSGDREVLLEEDQMEEETE